MSTLNTTGKDRYAFYFQKAEVTCLIVDEACQATEPSTLVAFQTLTKKIVLVGDHKQLQPTVIAKIHSHKTTKYNRSFFERLINSGAKAHLLTMQYRMVPQLRAFPSEQFYKDKLKDGVILKAPESLGLKGQSWFINVTQGTDEVVKKSYLNKYEANDVVFMISKLLSLPGDHTIGVISPYKSQTMEIQALLEQKDLGSEKEKKVKVSTVDAFQGQERDVIIMTCVRANEMPEIGFVRCPKRMNVSITRAKFALFVFGHAPSLLEYQE